MHSIWHFFGPLASKFVYVVKTEAALITEAAFSPKLYKWFSSPLYVHIERTASTTMPVIKLLLLIDLRNGFMIILQKDHKLQFPSTMLG